MATIDFNEVLLALIPAFTGSEPREGVSNRVATINVTNDAIPTDVSNVEVMVVRNSSNVVFRTTLTVNTGVTGEYGVSLPNTIFQEAGDYVVQARANSVDMSNRIDGTLTAFSDALTVTDTNQAIDNNKFDDPDYAKVTGTAFGLWQKIVLSGSDLKRALQNSGSDMGTASGSADLMNLPSGAMILNGVMDINQSFSGRGVTALTFAVGTNTPNFDELFTAVDALTVSRSTDNGSLFLPDLADSSVLTLKVDSTGGNLEDLDDTGVLNLYVNYASPQLIQSLT